MNVLALARSSSKVHNQESLLQQDDPRKKNVSATAMLMRDLLEMKQVLISRPLTQHQQAQVVKPKELDSSKRTISSLLKEIILQRNSKHLKHMTEKRRKKASQESATKRYFSTQGKEISFDKDL